MIQIEADIFNWFLFLTLITHDCELHIYKLQLPNQVAAWGQDQFGAPVSHTPFEIRHWIHGMSCSRALEAERTDQPVLFVHEIKSGYTIGCHVRKAKS